MVQKRRTGKLISCRTGDESYAAFLPDSLPPNPSVDLHPFFPLLDAANAALGRLDGMSLNLPDHSLFLYMYIRKEAVLSSQIEGTQSSLSDLLLFENEEAPGVPMDDVTEVSNYVAAMNYGLQRLQHFPLSLRLIREIHGKLMVKGRGNEKSPGDFRTSQNWIGGTRPGNAVFVPPPPEELIEALGSFEKFLHDEHIKLPILIKAALAHVQFESIHPFLDGNGRLGRLLVTFILCHEGILKEPLLYLSLYFKTHKQTYYSLLQAVRETGDWEAWIDFFLRGVIQTSSQATQTARQILQLFENDRSQIEGSGKSTVGVIKIHHYLRHHPLSNTTRIKEACDLSLPTVLRSLNVLEELGIVHEITGKERHKIFVYKDYLAILNNGLS